MSPVLSQLYHDGYMEATAVVQTDVFKAAEEFARVEGILPAPESAHAIKVAIDEALKCKETGEAKTKVFGLTGTGYFDMVAYQQYNDGKMTDYIPVTRTFRRASKGCQRYKLIRLRCPKQGCRSCFIYKETFCRNGNHAIPEYTSNT
jgi:tryptophan synthase beta chain